MAQIERITEDLQRPELDDRTYRVIRLPNKLEALLVHDPDTDKASASVNVNVGNFSDDIDMPGMAHAVEHLLFMGTKKVSPIAMIATLSAEANIDWIRVGSTLRKTHTASTLHPTPVLQTPTQPPPKRTTFLKWLQQATLVPRNPVDTVPRPRRMVIMVFYLMGMD